MHPKSRINTRVRRIQPNGTRRLRVVREYLVHERLVHIDAEIRNDDLVRSVRGRSGVVDAHHVFDSFS